jgi:hypothetical protein
MEQVVVENKENLVVENNEISNTWEIVENWSGENLVKTQEKEDANNSFKYDEKTGIYYWKIVLSWYISIIEREKWFCEENCPKFSYVFFNINNNNSKDFNNFLIEYKWNSFVNDSSISLWCVENDVITRINSSDKFWEKKYTTSLEESKIILNSTNKNLIKIEVEKLPLLGGWSAPDCYSHFAWIKVFWN